MHRLGRALIQLYQSSKIQAKQFFSKLIYIFLNDKKFRQILPIFVTPKKFIYQISVLNFHLRSILTFS